MAAALRVARGLGPDDLVVVLLPDSGRSYLSKVFSDDWLRGWGFLEEPRTARDTEPTVRSVLGPEQGAGGGWAQRLVTVESDASVGGALALLAAAPGGVAPVVLARRARPYGFSGAEVLGSLSLAAVEKALAGGRARPADPVTGLLGAALPTVGVGQSLPAAREALGREHDAAVVLLDGRAVALVHRTELGSAR